MGSIAHLASPLERALDRSISLCLVVSRAGAWCCGSLFLLAAILVGFEVVARKAFRYSIGGVDELSGLALGIGTAWGLSFALLRRDHVRIDSLHILVPRPVAVGLDILGTLLFTVFITLVSLRAWVVLSQSIRSGSRGATTLDVPLMIPQALWFGGLAFFVLVGCLLVLRAVLGLARGDLATAQSLIGSRSVTAEIEEHTASKDARPRP